MTLSYVHFGLCPPRRRRDAVVLNLVHGSPSKNVRKIRQRPPKELDVVWFSDIVVVLAGSLDGREANPSDIMHSGLLSRVRKQLKAACDPDM